MQVVMIFAGAGFIIGAIFMAAANGMALMIVGRVVMGLGVGAGTMIGPVYLAEMAPAKLRGSLNVIFQLFVSLCSALGEGVTLAALSL